MFKLSGIIKNYNETGALNEHINLYGFINNHVFLTKSGEVGLCLKLTPVDSECVENSIIDNHVKRFESALKLFDENFIIYQTYQKKSYSESDRELSIKKYPETHILNKTIANRAGYLQEKSASLFTTDITFTIIYKGNRYNKSIIKALSKTLTGNKQGIEELKGYFSTDKEVLLIESEIDKAVSTLHHKVNSFQNSLNDVFKLKLIDKQKSSKFLFSHLNFTPFKVSYHKLVRDAFLDYTLCGSSIDCHRNHLKVDDYYIKVLTLKEPSAKTYPRILKGISEINGNFTITTEFIREDSHSTRKEIQSKRRHFHNSKTSLQAQIGNGENAQPEDFLVDDAKVAMVGELGECIKELEMKGNYFGKFSLTIVIFSKNQSEIEKTISDFTKIFSNHDALLIDERYNILNAYLATIPGNYPFNLRYMYLMNTNYADYSFLFGINEGKKENDHLKAEYLAILETNYQTPYYMNLHSQDVGHSLILGNTGSGKSFLLNFIITMLQKYMGYTFIFDIGGSYRNLTSLFSGSYLKLTQQNFDIKINPFSLERTDENLDFLYHFFLSLISDQQSLTVKDERNLRDTIRQIYHLPENQRCLTSFVRLLPEELSDLYFKWTKEGTYGRFFDNTEDNLTFTKFQCFDFEGMDKLPAVLQPLLFYILHRANSVIYDDTLSGTLKSFILDETWKFFTNNVIKSYIVEALKTWRKKNAIMLMATQSIQDLTDSDILRIVLESCPTQIFLSNPKMDKAQYQKIFNLNPAEIEAIADLIPKKQFLLTSLDHSRICNLNVSPDNLHIYASHGINEAIKIKNFNAEEEI